MEGLRQNWEIVTGCERLTAGCDSCPSYWHYKKHGMDYTVKEQMQNLTQPSESVIPKIYSVAFGSDLFHESVSLRNLKRIFSEMNKARHHSFEILTKRIERACCLSSEFDWSPNIFMGVSVESGEYGWRIDYLKKIPAHYKYVSISPILGAFPDMDLSGINLVGVVEETWGFGRKAKREWVEDIERQCVRQNVEFSLNDNYLWESN